MGDYLTAGLQKLQKNFPFMKEIRGLGLLIGVECADAVGPVQQKCLQRGLMIGAAGPKVLRLMPPLTINKDYADRALSILEAALYDVQKEVKE